MKTICLDLTGAELANLRAEPLGYVTTACGPVWLPERMSTRITVHDCGCWLVSGHGTGKGHAKVWVSGKSRQFHRVIYQLLVGEIPAGLLLDHVKAKGCLFRNCANPDHLEPVTTRENTLRGDGVKHWFGWKNSLEAQADRAERREAELNDIPIPPPGADLEHPVKIIEANSGVPMPVLNKRLVYK